MYSKRLDFSENKKEKYSKNLLLEQEIQKHLQRLRVKETHKGFTRLELNRNKQDLEMYLEKIILKRKGTASLSTQNQKGTLLKCS